jgi:glycine/D-amino acid oxidase-like deaminating enzyme
MDALAGGPKVVFGLADRLADGAGVERSGTIVAAHASRVLPRLERRARYWQGRGASVELLDPRGAEAATGSRHYAGAYRDRRGGTINPLAYVRGLARGAATAGAALHERSRAVGIERQADSWRVATATGGVRAASVVLCTNGHTDDLWPGLRQTVIPARLYQYVTAPLTPAQRERILPDRPGMTDTYRVLSGVRTFADGRLQINGRGPRFGAAREGGWPAARARLATIWPELADIALDSWWTGWVAMNREDGWKVHELAPGVMAALGCNGRGVVIGTLIGRDIAAHLRGSPARDMLFPFAPLRPIPLHAVHRPIARSIVAWRAFRDRMDQRT